MSDRPLGPLQSNLPSDGANVNGGVPIQSYVVVTDLELRTGPVLPVPIVNDTCSVPIIG